MRPAHSLLLAALAAATLAGCATDYVGRTSAVRSAYEGYQPARALRLLDREFPADAGKDRLLVLLDFGMVAHAAGRWQESIDWLGHADRLTGELDTVSVSEEAGALLTNERHRAYRGEDFERLMISTLQALNYAGLGKDEDALVEVRRVNERLQKMIADEKKPYQQLAIARYLGGVLYEDVGDLDSAFIDYQDAQKLQPQLGELAEPLLRLAKATGRDEAYQALRKRYPGVGHAPLAAEEGQVLVVVEAGRSPEKEPRHVDSARAGEPAPVVVPRFKDRGAAARATVGAGGRALLAVRVTSIDGVAKVHLEDRVGRTLAMALAGTAVKSGVAAGVGALTRSKQAGGLAFLLLSLGNQADLRSWLSLPAEFQLARFRLPEGKQQVTVEYAGKRSTHEVEVRPGRVTLVVVRRY
ncbi:MAG: COG3014 family protein [Myxococcaceae bacterium]